MNRITFFDNKKPKVGQGGRSAYNTFTHELIGHELQSRN